jgi:alcohol dehydrogenase class IV
MDKLKTELTAPFVFHTTRTIFSAAGAASALPNNMLSLMGERVLIVTDASIRRLGLADPLIDSLSKAGVLVAVFDGVQADPPEKNIHDAVGMVTNLMAKGVIGIGGGSVMDVAKVVALIAGSRQSMVCMWPKARAYRLCCFPPLRALARKSLQLRSSRLGTPRKASSRTTYCRMPLSLMRN